MEIETGETKMHGEAIEEERKDVKGKTIEINASTRREEEKVDFLKFLMHGGYLWQEVRQV